MSKEHFLSDEEKYIVSQRIAELRKKSNMTQTEFAEAFASYLGRDKPFRYSTICNWENLKIPKQKRLYEIADFYGVESSYLLLDKAPMNDIASDNKMFEIKQTDGVLKMYNGQPVWCAFVEVSERDNLCGKWGIVDYNARCIVFSSMASISFDKINFSIYKRPIQFSYSLEGIGNPLTVTNLQKRSRIWIEPLNGEYEARQNMKGYGRYNKISDEVILENGLRFSMINYGTSFLAFDDTCEYKKENPIV